MVLSMCVKWSMTCIIIIIGAPLVVARHREFSFVDYPDENGYSIVDFSNMLLLLHGRQWVNLPNWPFGGCIHGYPCFIILIYIKKKISLLYYNFVQVSTPETCFHFAITGHRIFFRWCILQLSAGKYIYGWPLWTCFFFIWHIARSATWAVDFACCGHYCCEFIVIWCQDSTTVV